MRDGFSLGQQKIGTISDDIMDAMPFGEDSTPDRKEATEKGGDRDVWGTGNRDRLMRTVYKSEGG